MNTFFLVSNTNFSLNWFVERMSKVGRAEIVGPSMSISYPEAYLERESRRQWMFLCQSPLVYSDYVSDHEKQAIIRQYMRNPYYTVGRFGNVDIVNDFLRTLSDHDAFLVDNEYGRIATLRDVIGSIDRGEAWQELQP